MDIAKSWLLLKAWDETTHHGVDGSPLPSWYPPRYVWSICLFFYCAFVVDLVVETTDRHRRSEVFVWVSCVLAGYGGSLIVPALIGVSAAPLRRVEPIGIMSLAWWLHRSRYTGWIWRKMLKHVVLLRVLSKVCFETFRVAVIVGWIEESRRVLPEAGHIFGPLVCGTIGGSGGQFLPLDKGLEPLRSGVPWTAESAFWATVLYIYASHFISKEDARVLACLFLIVTRVFPSLQQAFSKTTHVLVHTILGLPISKEPKAKSS